MNRQHIDIFDYVRQQQEMGLPVTFAYQTLNRGIKNKTLTIYELVESGIEDCTIKFVYRFDKIQSFGRIEKATHRQQYVVYVLEVDEDPMKVYVGQTSRTREERLEQHCTGYKSAPSLRHAKSLVLRPDLYEGLPAVHTQEESLIQESLLAQSLIARGFTVLGGH